MVTEDATLGASGHEATKSAAAGTQGAPEAAGPVTEFIQAL